MRPRNLGLALLGLAFLAAALMGGCVTVPSVQGEPQTLHVDLIGDLSYNNLIYRWTDSETGAICYYTRFSGAAGVDTLSCIPGPRP